jgi:hypothetical protein
MSPRIAISRLAPVSVAARICLLACVTALLAGCGSDQEPTIPEQNATGLLTALDGISASVAEGSCDIALSGADDFRSEVFLLPASVDDQVKGGLFEVADRLEQLIEEQPGCASTTAGAGGEPEEPTTSTPTTTTPTTTTDTTTTETTTTDTTDTTTDTTQPDEEEEPPPVEPAPAPEEDDEGAPVSPPSGGIGGEKGAKG